MNRERITSGLHTESFKAYRNNLISEEFSRKLHMMGTVIWDGSKGPYVKSVHGPIGIDKERKR